MLRELTCIALLLFAGTILYQLASFHGPRNTSVLIQFSCHRELQHLIMYLGVLSVSVVCGCSAYMCMCVYMYVCVCMYKHFDK